MRVKLGDICEIVSGSTPSTAKKEYWDGDYKWITPADISSDDIYISDTGRKITERALKETGLSLFPEGTVLLSSRAPIGKVAIAGCQMCCNQGFKNLVCSFRVHNLYLYYFLKSKNAHLNSLGRGATFKEISKSIVADISIELPPIHEQIKIATRFYKVWELINHLQSLLLKFDELVKARFVEMFGNINTQVPLKHYIGSLIAGKSLAGEEECEHHVLKTGAISYDYYDDTQIKPLPKDFLPDKKTLVNSGDVLISRMNTSELVGASAYVWQAQPNTYIPDRLWKAIPNERVNAVFLWQLMIQQTTKKHIRKNATGTSGSMKNISKSALLNIPVIAVSEEQQNAFAAFVEEVDKSKVVVQKSLEKAQQLYDSLMQQYFD